jgi:hypothetical protein
MGLAPAEDESDPAAESDLAEVLALIWGEGKYRGHGSGLWTHPGGDAEDDALHRQCCELERRGLARRKERDPDGATLWEARPGLKITQEEE